MKILLIETSLEKSVLLLAEDKKLIATQFLSGGVMLSRNLAVEVKKLLEAYQFSPQKIAVGLGPGSFTGIRVGASFGQALAYGWNIPIVGIGSLWGFAPPVEGAFAILLDARSGGFYVQKGRKESGKYAFSPPFLAPLSDISLHLEGVAHLASPHPALIESRWKNGKNLFETSPDPELLCRLVYEQEIPSLNFSYCSSP